MKVMGMTQLKLPQIKVVKKKNFIKRKKSFYNSKSLFSNTLIPKHLSLITKTNHFLKKPYKKYIKCNTVSNFEVFIPGLDHLNIGKVLSYYKKIIYTKRIFSFRGLITYLYMIPITSAISNVTNKLNNKITYAKSAGTFCKLKKPKKTKKKLIKLVLPSSNEILLNKLSKGYIGKNCNFYLPKLVEGKWGYSLHKTKHINVRGVAMNPVDHPNGGRTKSVKPEKSPWSWIAKKKK